MYDVNIYILITLNSLSSDKLHYSTLGIIRTMYYYCSVKRLVQLAVKWWDCICDNRILTAVNNKTSDVKVHPREQIMTRIIRVKAVPLQAWSDPEGSRKLRFPDFMTTA